MTGYYVIGSVLAAWAVLVSFLGIFRSGFPASAAAERLVALISIVLVAGTIGAAVFFASEAEEDVLEEEDHAALILPR